MTDGMAVLAGTAASIGFLHTLLGPDHYLPFVAMSRAGGWTLTKTMTVTLLCGVGHVLGSVLLGTVGIAFGVGVLKLEVFESLRADLAGWLLLTVGLLYFVWGVRRAIRYTPHRHPHGHADGTVHTHEHTHSAHHLHVHGSPRRNASDPKMHETDVDTEIAAPTPHNAARSRTGEAPGRAAPDRMNGASITPWVLFTVFLFGPCEPLIPLLMYPAARGGVAELVTVAVIFAVVTLATMTAAVLLLHASVSRMGSMTFGPFGRLERYSHAVAGFVLLLCGAGLTMGL